MSKNKKNGLCKLIVNVCKKNVVLPREWAGIVDSICFFIIMLIHVSSCHRFLQNIVGLNSDIIHGTHSIQTPERKFHPLV